MLALKFQFPTIARPPSYERHGYDGIDLVYSRILRGRPQVRVLPDSISCRSSLQLVRVQWGTSWKAALRHATANNAAQARIVVGGVSVAVAHPWQQRLFSFSRHPSCPLDGARVAQGRHLRFAQRHLVVRHRPVGDRHARRTTLPRSAARPSDPLRHRWGVHGATEGLRAEDVSWLTRVVDWRGRLVTKCGWFSTVRKRFFLLMRLFHPRFTPKVRSATSCE